MGTALAGIRSPVVVAKTEKAIARADGEDALTPLIEKAAEAVAAAVMRK